MQTSRINNFGFKQIVTLKELSFLLGIPVDVLKKLSKEPTKYYHPFQKAREGKKSRKIANPDKSLKSLQRKVVKKILDNVVLPEEMFGAVKGRNLKSNAAVHVHQPVVVTMDIRDCFPSVTYRMIFNLFRKEFLFSEEVSSCLTKLTTYRGSLPQGAPTSSALLNILLIPICRKLKTHFKRNGCRLTFWVDDIAFSGPNAFLHIQLVAKQLQKIGFSIRSSKIRVMYKGKRQEVTGLNVDRIVSVPRYRLERYLRELNLTEPSSLKTLAGRINYIQQINPLQAISFEKKVVLKRGV